MITANTFIVIYTAAIVCITSWASCLSLYQTHQRQIRQIVKYVYVALKVIVAVTIFPLLVLLFIVSPSLFLPVFSWLWPHLDILGENGDLYLRRWFMTPKTKLFRPRFLHLIARSDEGRDSHDHPGAFTTRVLKGGYLERVYFPYNQFIRDEYGLYIEHSVEQGDVRVNYERHTHMLTLLEPTWTWVVGWKRGKPWGFFKLHPTDASQDRWIESEAYGAKGIELKSWEIEK